MNEDKNRAEAIRELEILISAKENPLNAGPDHADKDHLFLMMPQPIRDMSVERLKDILERMKKPL
jgi:hypothetical protein